MTTRLGLAQRAQDERLRDCYRRFHPNVCSSGDGVHPRSVAAERPPFQQQLSQVSNESSMLRKTKIQCLICANWSSAISV